jgi:uncharacterized protein YndB with AHSA1/START domain
MNDQQTPAKAVVTTPADREIRVERWFDAPLARVWAAYTDPELIPEWYGGHGSTTTVDTMDVRPGGQWRFVIRAPDGSEHGFRGTYREVEPPHRLVQTWEWEGMPGHVSIEIAEFEEVDGRTKLTGTTLFHTPEERDGMLVAMEGGMDETFERLDALLARGA